MYRHIVIPVFIELGSLFFSDLSAGIVKNLDMRRKSLIHNVRGDICRVGQVPEQRENLLGHHTVLVVLG